MKTRSIALTALFCGLVIAVHSAARAELVGYWSFDDSTADDLSDNNNDGAITNVVEFSDDIPSALGSGKAVFVERGKGFITVPTSPSLESISDELTVAFWVKSDDGEPDVPGEPSDNQWPNWGRVFQHGTEGNGDQSWLVNRNSGTTDVNLRVDTVAGPPRPDPPYHVPGFNQNVGRTGDMVIDGTWHHWVMTLDNGLWTKYLDGSPAGSGSYVHGDGFANTRPLYILGRNGYNEFGGFIDDVSVWNSALDLWGVEQLYMGAPATSLPEPSSVLLLALGGLGLVFSSRRRRRT
jgi:hypothetical protein